VTFVIQLSVDMVRAMRHLQAFFSRDQAADDSLVIKTMLTEAFGGAVIRPWAIHVVRNSEVIVVGYSDMPASEANERLALALPTVQAAVGPAASAELPVLREGRSYRFAVRLVPTIRVTKKEGGPRYGERDAFLTEADRRGVDAGLTRDEVYKAYLVERLPGAEVHSCRLAGFSLARLVRPRSSGKWDTKTFPDALLEGTLKVVDGDALLTAITKGIGRQRVYGFGMLRLQPDDRSVRVSVPGKGQ
jgi:CRISPR system Cascade subunit CasE